MNASRWYALFLGSLIGPLTLVGCERPTEPVSYRNVPPLAGISYICPEGSGTSFSDCTNVGLAPQVTTGEEWIHLRGMLPVTASCDWWNGLRVFVTYPDGQTGRVAVYTEYNPLLARCFSFWCSSGFHLKPGANRVSVTAQRGDVNETDALIINYVKSGASHSAQIE